LQQINYRGHPLLDGLRVVHCLALGRRLHTQSASVDTRLGREIVARIALGACWGSGRRGGAGREGALRASLISKDSARLTRDKRSLPCPTCTDPSPTPRIALERAARRVATRCNASQRATPRRNAVALPRSTTWFEWFQVPHSVRAPKVG
jgi:hypothetical protein